jgi:membrane protease YdiL (CAAX protease family)
MARQSFTDSAPLGVAEQGMGKVYLFFALACAATWLLAAPLSLEWSRHQPQSAFAVACAGFSAFGPLFAVLAVASRSERRDVFGRFRAAPAWVALALVSPLAIHVAATALFVLLGGTASRWFHPPPNAEALAALVVFPLGEELGWRGFAYPKMAQRFGIVKGSLILGAIWGVWHLGYGITPEKGAFDVQTFALTVLELPLCSVLIAWVMERANRGMAVAIAFHAGAHLDNLERDPSTALALHGCHLVVLAVLAALAARSLGRMESLAAARREALGV